MTAYAQSPDTAATPAAPEAPAPAPVEQPTPAPEAPAPAPEAPSPAEQPAAPAPEAQPAPVAKKATVEDAYRGIVKVEVAANKPNFRTPWQTGGFGRGNGTGFMVAPGLFMTNAHVVADTDRIYISPYADSRKLRAHVKFVAHDADLALVEVEDASAFQDVPCLEFSDEIPQLEDHVRAVGYPIGGNRLSVTSGIVSRIDSVQYSHPRNASHLALQIDAAINPGNSGGPVLKGDKVIGVAFQGLMQANSTGYVIPISVINHFLQDVKDGKYDGYVNVAAEFLPAENPALREYLNLPKDATGCLVSEVAVGGSSDGALKPGDVVLAVNGHTVDSSAMINLDGVRVPLEELAERSFSGDKVKFTLMRDGKQIETEGTLSPLKANKVLTQSYDQLPRYVEFGGLVFQPMQADVISAWNISPKNYLVELDEYVRGGAANTKEDIVVLTQVLPDEVNARLDSYGRRIVKKVNGVEVKGLSHLYELLYPQDPATRPAYTVIEVADADRPLVFDNATIDAANARIRTNYNIQEPARLNTK